MAAVMPPRSAMASAKTARPGALLIAIHEFNARSPDEITLHKGDRVELIERDDDFNDGWYLGKLIATGKTGLFPEVYTSVAPNQAMPAKLQTPAKIAASTSTPDLQSTLGSADGHGHAAMLDQAPALQSLRAQSRTPEPASAATFENAATPLPSVPEPGEAPHEAPNAVMTETLSVIDEHITDMAKPNRNRNSFTRQTADYQSDYSNNQSAERLSYIQGSETEEEEETKPTKDQVMKWTPQRVAEYLEDNGVERRHCEVFIEQEMSGEVVLSMDQATLFMKDLDLGPIGRRLKTWNRIKELQEAVKTPSAPSEAFTAASPRGHRKSMRASDQHYKSSSLGSTTNSPRPSAASIRSLGQARRQSSIDQALVESPQDLAPSHTQQSSLDRGWTMGNAARHTSGGASYPRPTSTVHSVGSYGNEKGEARSNTTSQTSLSAHHDVERGYVSNAEGDARSQTVRNTVLRKGQLPGHDRSASATSGASEKRRLSFFGVKKSPRPESDIGSPAHSPIITSDASADPNSSNNKENHRVVSEPGLGLVAPPMDSAYANVDLQAPAGQSVTRERSATASTSEGAARKGFRAISDAITGKERSFFKFSAPPASTNADSVTTTTESPRSSTPSGANKSLDLDDANKGPYSTSTPAAPPRRKGKKETSAYVLGLEKKAPQAAMVEADYCGWMKKKSSNLMANWKPRLFILRGRRLSYYYSENDTEEKGLIDISGHRVLSADNEKLTGLHATLTGATSSPTSPNMNGAPSPTTSEGLASPQVPKDGSGFIFKLVPPRNGMSRGVNFTKPTVHYFAVPSVEEGRLWMAALMKATIDRDEGIDVITTYQLKTIPLSKARARKERPPALQNLDEEENPAGGGAHEESGDHLTALQPQASNSNTSHYTAEEGHPDESRDQITEVTDLESPMTRTSLGSATASRRGSRRRSSLMRTISGGSGNSSTTGLGIDVQVARHDPSGSPSPPVLERMSSAGLW